MLNHPHKMMTKSEAERHLNFNPLPNDETQKKIDYFITPYNRMKVVTKFMNFNEVEACEPINLSSRNKWKKVRLALWGKLMNFLS